LPLRDNYLILIRKTKYEEFALLFRPEQRRAKGQRILQTSPATTGIEINGTESSP
jgi:hypothetical protein